MSRYGTGMRVCCDSVAREGTPHIKGCQSSLVREEVGHLLLPFLSDEMTFAQSCQLADQLISLVRRHEPERVLPPIEARRVETGTGSMRSTKAG